MIDEQTYNAHMRELTDTIADLAGRIRQLAAVPVPIAGVVGPHNILSLTHLDSTPQAVSRGSLIYGDATPTWNELVLGGGAGSFLRRDATDVLWSTLLLPNAATTGDILYATGANTIGALADVAVGQALVSGGVGVIPAYSATPTLTGLTLSGLTVSTVVYSNAAKAITSLANAAGYLTNNGAGALSWSATATPTAHAILSASHSDAVVDAVTRGSLIYGNATPAWDELVLGAPGQAVISDGADAVWGAPIADAHNLLSVVHGDAVVNAATRGSLIYGNHAPAWNELVLGGIARSVLTRNATDVLWSAFGLAGTAGQTYTFPGASASIPGGSGAANRVAYWSGANVLTSDAGLFVDAANDLFLVADGGGIATNFATARLLFDSSGATDYAYFSDCNVGINIIIPAYLLDVEGNARFGAGNGILVTNFQIQRQVVDYLAIGTASYNNTLVLNGGNVGIMTTAPDRLFHAEVADAVTVAITYATRTSHTTSGAAAALYGVGHEDELEDAAGNMQVASEQVTLWGGATSGAESPLYRVTTYPQGSAGPGYSGYWTWNNLDNNARTIIPNGAGDVTATMTLIFAISESGGGTSGGMQTCANNSTVDLYDDGTDVFTLTVAADGSVTIVRSAGATTADISLWMTWV